MELVLTIAGVSGLIISKNIIKISSNKINLKNLSKYDGYLINSEPYIDPASVEERKSNVDFTKIERLKDYVERLENFIPQEQLKTLYRNLEKVKIDNMNPVLSLMAMGFYDPLTNTIAIKDDIILRHEIFHLASLYYDAEKEEAYGGFRQVSKTASIGTGIDEGYTDLLSKRVFYIVPPSPYEKEIRIVELIELFFDDPKDMQELYFNHNLPGLIHYMEQFAPREDIINLILQVDAIYHFAKTKCNPIPFLNHKRVQLLLYEWFLKSNPSPLKLAQFERLLSEDIIVAKQAKSIKNKYYESNEEYYEEHRKLG